MSTSTTKKITISISEETYLKLQDQLIFIKNSPVDSFREVSTVEELIEKYIEHLTATNQNYEKIQEKMQEMMKAFSSKGLDIAEILNTFSEKIFDKDKKPSKKDFNKKS